MGFWGFGVLGFWGFGVLGFWGFGVLGFWGFGVLGFWGFGVGRMLELVTVFTHHPQVRSRVSGLVGIGVLGFVPKP